MKMQDISPDEAKSRLGELIDAALRGERIVIARDDQQAVQLVPVTPPRRARKAGSAKGLIVIRDDFDETLSEMME
jgi:antitoxin (DNA-binding transcriptional repressor) of toxin-antitoxin stability system